MIPLVVGAGEPAPPGSLGVDGDPTGATAYLSHWPGTPLPPPGCEADTTTGQGVAAARHAPAWLGRWAVACNNHLDADGLLALAACCRPETARAHGALLTGAAEAGDFSAWPGEAAFRLLLRVHQHLRDHGGPGREQACIDQAVAALPVLIAEAARHDPERDAQTAQVLAVRARLAAAPPRCGPRLALVAWERRLGHAWDQFGTVHAPDDLPLWALDGLVPADRAQLLVEQAADGRRCTLDAPRHSWARTVQRPAWAWPDLGPLAERLRPGERGGGRWIAGPEARRVGFTTLLACVGPDGAPCPTSHPPEALAAAAEAALAAPG